MKITDEMVRRIADELFRRGWYVAGHDYQNLHRALTAALADMPEPLPALSGPAGVGKCVDATQRCFELEARVVELERASKPRESKG